MTTAEEYTREQRLGWLEALYQQVVLKGGEPKTLVCCVHDLLDVFRELPDAEAWCRAHDVSLYLLAADLAPVPRGMFYFSPEHFVDDVDALEWLMQEEQKRKTLRQRLTSMRRDE